MKIKSFLIFLAAAAIFLVSTTLRAADDSTLGEPAKAVLDHYIKIQTQLAKDSLRGLDAQAAAIAKAVNSDDARTFSPEVAKQAEALAQAKDIAAAREAFKPLSASLIKFLAANKNAKGSYHQVFCPMAKASWLQTGKEIRNPYFGKDMLDCGEFKD